MSQQIKALYYSVPETLEKERELVIEKCNLLIEAFNCLADEERIRLRKLRKDLLKNRIYIYYIEQINDNWSILVAEAINPIENADDNITWSRPFKIINNVLFHSDNAHKSCSASKLTNLIPQGIVSDNFIHDLLNDLNKTVDNE